jgi:8-oxo-dGTP diphosphatase
MRQWVVASGLIEGPDGLLLVQNRRRNGRVDWSPPGGVVEVESGESVLDGLTREVEEETGISVREWDGPVYDVEAEADELGWRVRVEVFRAVDWSGDLVVDDPDGIVVEATFAAADACTEFLALCAPWVREPLADWIEHRWGPDDARSYTYDVFGADRDELRVVRI